MESLGGVSDLELVPINFDEACAFIAEHHRHHDPPVGCKFCVGVARAVVIVGVAVVGRPVARSAADTWTAEVTRVCVFDPVAKDTNGGHASGANSMLYAACWRAARALGYRKLITYELPEEGGGRACAAQDGSASGRPAEVRGTGNPGHAWIRILRRSN